MSRLITLIFAALMMVVTSCTSKQPVMPPTTRSVEAHDLPADYRIHKGDLLFVSINDMQSSGSATELKVRVKENGAISLPLINDVPAEGKTTAELENLIGATYVAKRYLRSPMIEVKVLEIAVP